MTDGLTGVRTVSGRTRKALKTVHSREQAHGR